MGLGKIRGGVDVVRFLHKAGAKITVTDSAPAEKFADSLKQLSGFGRHRISFRLAPKK